MDPTPHASGPGRSTRFHDPFAIALANASLFGAGYAMLGSWLRMFITSGITVALLLVVGMTDGAGWWMQGVVACWWVSTIAHGWFVAHRARTVVPSVETTDTTAGMSAYAPPGSSGRSDDNQLRSPRRQRLIAFGVVVPVLLIFGMLRVDAWRIEQTADEAHLAGQCARAMSRLDGLWFGHRLADAPLTERAQVTAKACGILRKAREQASDDRLAAESTLRRYAAHPAARWDGVAGMRADLLLGQAGDDLDTALTGDLQALDTGFEELSTVLEEIPNRRTDVDQVLQDFLDGLPTKDACNTALITGWLDDQLPHRDRLDQALDTVARTEPKAMVGCGDDLLEKDEPHEAKERYQQLLSEYPKHKQVKPAKDGLTLANQEIELRKVRQLVQTPYAGEKPEYCENPAPYSAAKPYKGNGPHPTLLYGKDNQRKKLPSSWKADGPKDAVLVICAGSSKHGSVVERCWYTSGAPHETQVSFHKRKIPVKVYEVRTGNVVKNGSIQISGESCPATVHYEIFTDQPDTGPPSDMYVDSSKSDIRDGYRPLIDP